jgi:hypothetical protein
MFRVTLVPALFLVALALLLFHVSWTLWQSVWRDWAMVARGVTVLAAVTEVVPVMPGDSVHWASITIPRIDGTSFQGRVRGWPGHSFAEGDQVPVRYDPTGQLEPRMADRWLWKAAAASLFAHVVTFVLALGALLVGIGVVVRVAVDVRF